MSECNSRYDLIKQAKTSVFNTDPYERFAEKIFNKMND